LEVSLKWNIMTSLPWRSEVISLADRQCGHQNLVNKEREPFHSAHSFAGVVSVSYSTVIHCLPDSLGIKLPFTLGSTWVDSGFELLPA
jgi:hypothetical protein